LIRGLAVVAAVVPALAVPAGAGAVTPEQVARALQRDPVYAEPGADPGLSQQEAGRIRIRIVERDIGRIKVAVVKKSSALAQGGSKGFANAVDRDLHIRGTLLVSAGSSIHMVVSHQGVDRTIQAVSDAVESKKDDGLGEQLLEAVSRIATVDPGPSGDDDGAGDSGGISDPAVGKEAHDFLGTVKTALLVVALAIALPFVLGSLWVMLRLRRRRVEQLDALAQDREDARNGLVALGDQIRELDLDESMPDADPQGRANYERALAEYERADEAMAGRPTRAKLDRAAQALGQGRASMAEAARLLERQAQAPPER
jgi:hypothetical protein